MTIFVRKMLFVAAVASLGALAQPASAQVNREIHFFNTCPAAVRLFVYHQHGDGAWATHGWFAVAGSQLSPTRLTYSNGNPLVHIDGRPLYFYAESTNGAHVWEGQTRASFNGVSYGLGPAMLSVSGGRLQFGINCDRTGGTGGGGGGGMTTVNPNLQPVYGRLSLNAGFLPDPRRISLRAGGPIPAERVGSNCRGYVSGAPSVRLFYGAGRTFPLIISVGSRTDTTLVIRAPNGSWHCDDDGGFNGLNPGLRFDRPLTGQYDIWVGVYSSSAGQQPATLEISELSSQ